MMCVFVSRTKFLVVKIQDGLKTLRDAGLSSDVVKWFFTTMLKTR